jgi:hypothetical protein
LQAGGHRFDPGTLHSLDQAKTAAISGAFAAVVRPRPLASENRAILLSHSRQGYDELRIRAGGLPLPGLSNLLEWIRLDVEDDLARGSMVDEA